jgi:hypothetical protein
VTIEQEAQNMDKEIVELLKQILAELKQVNKRLDNITLSGSPYSIWDICEKLDTVSSNVENVVNAVFAVNEDNK